MEAISHKLHGYADDARVVEANFITTFLFWLWRAKRVAD